MKLDVMSSSRRGGSKLYRGTQTATSTAATAAATVHLLLLRLVYRSYRSSSSAITEASATTTASITTLAQISNMSTTSSCVVVLASWLTRRPATLFRHLFVLPASTFYCLACVFLGFLNISSLLVFVRSCSFAHFMLEKPFGLHFYG